MRERGNIDPAALERSLVQLRGRGADEAMHDALRRLFQLTNSPWKWTAWLRPSSTSALSPCAVGGLLEARKVPALSRRPPALLDRCATAQSPPLKPSR